MSVTNGRVETNINSKTRYYVNWYLVSQDQATLSSLIAWDAGINEGTAQSHDYYTNNAMKIYDVSIDDTPLPNSSGTWSNINQGGDVQLLSGQATIYHGSDGKKTFKLHIGAWTYSNSTYSGENYFELPDITVVQPGVTILEHEIEEVTPTSIRVHWETDVDRDRTEYSLDGGITWTVAFDEIVSDSNGSYEIENLTPGTFYTIKSRFRRKDNQELTVSDTLSTTTPQYLMRTKTNGSWEQAMPYIKVSGTWKQATPMIKVNGSWENGI